MESAEHHEKCIRPLDDAAVPPPAPLALPDNTETEMRRRLEIARLVADSWRQFALRHGDIRSSLQLAAHPLVCVMAALDGETRPEHLGIDEGPTADAIRALSAAASPVPAALPPSPVGPAQGDGA
jgi:hypothetical protein